MKLKKLERENSELKNRLAAKQLVVDDHRDVLLDNSFLKNRTLASPDLSLKDELRREIENKFNAMRKTLVEDTIARAAVKASQTTFTSFIAFFSKPQKFNMTVLRMFDGKTSPEEHIFHYIQ